MTTVLCGQTAIVVCPQKTVVTSVILEIPVVSFVTFIIGIQKRLLSEKCNATYLAFLLIIWDSIEYR